VWFSGIDKVTYSVKRKYIYFIEAGEVPEGYSETLAAIFFSEKYIQALHGALPR
jgi:hypothetical protein